MYNKSNPEDMIIGRNPVMEAIKAERPINKILIAKGERKGSINQLISMAKEKRLVIQEVEHSFLNNMTDNANHQGVAALVSPFEYVEVDDILKIAAKSDRKPFILIADGVTDPHNLGALIRTAEALGVNGIIIPKRNSSAITSTVVKSSAGAVEYLPVARETNIVRCIEQLKKEGMWVIGADMDGKELLSKADFTVPIVLVVGGEDKGLGRLVKENCDIVVKIPMLGKISSLNASVAGAIMMYEVARQRG